MPGLSEKHYFLIRRLHSLSGLIPLGVFLVFHLGANSLIRVPTDPPGAMFQQGVDGIHGLGPLVYPVEIIGIFLPLAFHTVVGIMIAFTGRPNTQAYRYGGNIRYTLQRVTAYIALVFILYHLYHMHWTGKPFGGGHFEPHDAANSAAAAMQQANWIAIAYVIGVLATVFHLANGIWTSLITWGITIKPRSQQVAGYYCTALGIVMAIVGLIAVNGFRSFDVNRSIHAEFATPAATRVAEHE
jgi:succinate dehydrogenase / fumarate reductase cytochrome b subunit